MAVVIDLHSRFYPRSALILSFSAHNAAVDDALCARSIFEPLSWCGAHHATENNTAAYTAFPPEWSGPIPWTFTRGPELWEQRLRQHWAPRGVKITADYLKVHKWAHVQIQSTAWLRGQ